MKYMKLFVVCVLLVLAGLLGACSDDDDGGGNVCEQAFNKQKDCAKDLDCTALSGVEQTVCEVMKALGQITYAQAQEACEQQTPGACECTGQVKADAEDLMDCTLDPATCACPDDSTTTDAGVQADQGSSADDGGTAGDA